MTFSDVDATLAPVPFATHLPQRTHNPAHSMADAPSRLRAHDAAWARVSEDFVEHARHNLVVLDARLAGASDAAERVATLAAFADAQRMLERSLVTERERVLAAHPLATGPPRGPSEAQ